MNGGGRVGTLARCNRYIVPPMPSPMSYDVSLSFAGEDRSYVEMFAQSLRAANVRVFYDAYEEVALWGRDLYQHLDQVYSSSRYCVIFVSEAYARKVWTRHELRSAQARALTEQREYILPARFDATEIPGLPESIKYIDLSGRTPEEFAQLVLRKLKEAEEPFESAGLGSVPLEGSIDRSTRSTTNEPGMDRIVNRPILERFNGRTGIAVALVIVFILVLMAVVTLREQKWTDQSNCSSDERWGGMTPNKSEWSGQVTPEQAKHAFYHGEFRWSPGINQVKKTTVGRVELEVDGLNKVIYRWNSPNQSTYSFAVNLSPLLVGTSGRFEIRWVWEDGSSGVCVAKSYVGMSDGSARGFLPLRLK